MSLRKLELSTPNFRRGRHGERPRAIVIHTTVGSFESAASWFALEESKVSAHYLVGLDGRVASFVAEEHTALHAGRVLDPTVAIAAGTGSDGVNPFTIGIEFEDGGDPLGVARTEAQYEAGARLVAEIAERWSIPLDREHVIGHREVFAAKECPGNLSLPRLLARATQLGAVAEAAWPRSPERLACLLPARNAQEDLPGWLESVAALGADVVALDDGSSDRTPELLEASPMVRELLRRPRRLGWQGWDDGANRRLLLERAETLEPAWILFLDADERIDPDDAAALRRFLAGDAVEGLAYGLRLYRGWGDSRVLPTPSIVYRLFDHRPGDALRPGRLHFNPVPTRIGRSRWLETTIRARHLDSPARLAGRREKYAEADPAGTPPGPASELLREPSHGAVPWWPRPRAMAVLDGGAPKTPPPSPDDDHPRLTCLLPVRNAEDEIPGYLECVRLLGARIVALDDGSTDAGADLLAASPLVERLLRNPRRESYAGWDDAANRQALLDAAVDSGAEWILFLDADERIDAADAEALRSFLAAGADPGCAYGFRVHRMVGADSYDRAGLWVYRLFAAQPGQRLPETRLHLVPVPTSIPPGNRRLTTIRIQHFGAADEARRRQRLRKYEEADPDHRWQADYTAAIRAAGRPRAWRARPAGLPVLADPAASGGPLDLEEIADDLPILSVIVIATEDASTIEGSLEAILGQRCADPFEVIVVVSGSPTTASVVRERFGTRVTLVELTDRVSPGRARNEGLTLARGEFASFPGSHVKIAPGSLGLRIRAHERGWAMVTGSIRNGTRTRAGWASYFLDHSSALPGRPSGPLEGAPAHCSYVREFILGAGGFPAQLRAGEDTVLNQELWRRGHRAWREQAMELTHRSPCTDRRSLVRHHFSRGRGFGRILTGEFSSAAGGRRPGAGGGLRGYRKRRQASTDARIAEWGGDELQREYRRARRLVRLGILAAWAGARWELATGSRGGS